MNKRISMLLTFVLILSLVGVAPINQSAVAVEKVKLNKSSLTLKVGATSKLVLKNAKGKISWKSTQKKVASVDKKGVVKAKKTGSAAIIALFKGKNYYCNVMVVPKADNGSDDTPKPIYTVKPSAMPVVTTVPTLAPTIAPTIVPTVAPTIAPTVAPTLVPTATPTPSPSTPEEHRLALKEYIKNKGTKDSSTGYYKLKYSLNSSSNMTQTVYLEYDPEKDRVELELIANTYITSYPYGKMSSAASVYFDINGNADLYWTDFTYDSSDKMKHTGMLSYKGTTVSQVGDKRTYPWTIELNSGSGSYVFSDDGLIKLADANMELAMSSIDTCFLIKISDIKTSLKELGFDITR